jgi:hypothetical protein
MLSFASVAVEEQVPPPRFGRMTKGRVALPFGAMVVTITQFFRLLPAKAEGYREHTDRAGADTAR